MTFAYSAGCILCTSQETQAVSGSLDQYMSAMLSIFAGRALLPQACGVGDRRGIEIKNLQPCKWKKGGAMGLFTCLPRCQEVRGRSHENNTQHCSNTCSFNQGKKVDVSGLRRISSRGHKDNTQHSLAPPQPVQPTKARMHHGGIKAEMAEH